MALLPVDANVVTNDVRIALAEDVGGGDITAELLPADVHLQAQVISREFAILCGQAWFTAVYAEVSPDVDVTFLQSDGDELADNTVVCKVSGPARAVLTGERAALNFIQTLSGTATKAHFFAEQIAPESNTKILDTRKTIPGLRQAQKYAVRCGGCHNHRMGLYDAILIKENHIQSAGSIPRAVALAKEQHPGIAIEVETENLTQLQEAVTAKADIVMLDNFSQSMIRDAVVLASGRVKLEVSGNVTINTIPELSLLGVDYISSGALTKDIQSIDFSMRFIDAP